ncbi:MAG: ATP-binding protein [Phascolarctobacterium sp.]|uniref:sensor histidine kinase n=1 Tax=Phascolarctobacterium sp. TaxID=2049039 RepID=UPI0026DD50BF|nr:ATP-binding protein [Phascolarctobacterium sp.]MDO4920284.1 ATP-binding protein [Phascolarctobacterium sp.]
MMKNKIALKLTLYFTAVLLVFALIIGGVFYEFFRQHTIDLKKREMRVQAQKIAEVISDNMGFLEQRYGAGISSSRFINYLDNITQEIVWVVDSERGLNINKERMERQMQARRQKMHGHGRHGGMQMPAPPQNPKEAYDKLPPHIREKVEQGFAGQRFNVEEYNDWLDGIMLTVGEPVYDKTGAVKAVVLLHSPVQGLHDAIWAGLRILFLSVLAALALGVVLSVILSWRFTRPMKLMRNNAERLAERDYEVRNDIVQKDEIGELARTLDILAQRLQLADEESQKLEKLRRDFIANISHELRTPVTVIRGSLEALRDGVVTDKAEVEEFHEQMYNESIFLQRLINDLLDLSRLQNTDFPIEKAPLNLCDVIQDAARGSRQLGKEKNLQITSRLDTDLYMLNGDYGRLRQMLMIFLHNSIKFSPEGGGIELRLAGGKLQIIDYGCGIKPEDVPHAFDRFYKARNEQNKSGSGLGLAIAKQIALRHDMQLELSSELGAGTTITVLLPPQLKMKENDNEEA